MNHHCTVAERGTVSNKRIMKCSNGLRVKNFIQLHNTHYTYEGVHYELLFATRTIDIKTNGTTRLYIAAQPCHAQVSKTVLGKETNQNHYKKWGEDKYSCL